MTEKLKEFRIYNKITSFHFSDFTKKNKKKKLRHKGQSRAGIIIQDISISFLRNKPTLMNRSIYKGLYSLNMLKSVSWISTTSFIAPGPWLLIINKYFVKGKRTTSQVFKKQFSSGQRGSGWAASCASKGFYLVRFPKYVPKW